MHKNHQNKTLSQYVSKERSEVKKKQLNERNANG